MLLLTSVADLVQVISDSVSDIRCHTSWVDNASGVITPGRTNTPSIVTATTTTVVGSPAAGTQRNVKRLTFHNNHVSASCGLRVLHTDGTTAVNIGRATLLPGEMLVLNEGEWEQYNVAGLSKLANGMLDVTLQVTADSVHATAATFAVITGLTYPVKSGVRYVFDACLFHLNNATTTGAQFGVGGVAMTTMIAGAVSTVTNSPTAAIMSTGVATAVNTAVVVQTTGSVANAPTYLSGMFQPSADGTFEIRATSEVTVAAGLTVKAGSWAWIRQVDN